MKNAIILLIGEEKVKNNLNNIEVKFLSYMNARKYVLGELQPTSPDKEKKWVENYRDSDGNLVLKLKAWVDLKKLKEDLKTELPTETSPSESAETQKSDTSSKENVKSSSDESLKNVDLSSLTFLVYYNPANPIFKNNPEEENYAKWAVDWINRGLSSLGVKTFDLETLEKLVKERNLLQEANTGNIGVGLLLAQKVYAELYAEVSPVVTYDDKKVNVIINVKVFVRTTGALISTMDKGSGNIVYEGSPTPYIKGGMKKSSEKIIEELEITLKKYINSGRFYNITLTGVSSYRDASKFTTLASKIEGMININLKSGSKEDMVYIYDVQFKGTPSELVDKLFEVLEGKSGFEKFDLNNIRGNEITFSLN